MCWMHRLIRLTSGKTAAPTPTGWLPAAATLLGTASPAPAPPPSGPLPPTATPPRTAGSTGRQTSRPIWRPSSPLTQRRRRRLGVGVTILAGASSRRGSCPLAITSHSHSPTRSHCRHQTSTRGGQAQGQGHTASAPGSFPLNPPSSCSLSPREQHTPRSSSSSCMAGQALLPAAIRRRCPRLRRHLQQRQAPGALLPRRRGQGRRQAARRCYTSRRHPPLRHTLSLVPATRPLCPPPVPPAQGWAQAGS